MRDDVVIYSDGDGMSEVDVCTYSKWTLFGSMMAWLKSSG